MNTLTKDDYKLLLDLVNDQIHAWRTAFLPTPRVTAELEKLRTIQAKLQELCYG
jgi:hypothetical protein